MHIFSELTFIDVYAKIHIDISHFNRDTNTNKIHDNTCTVYYSY